MEVEAIIDQNPSAMDDDAELFGIDDVDAFIEITVKKIVYDVFEDISEKVDMGLAEEVVKEIESDVDQETTNVVVTEPHSKEDMSISAQCDEKVVDAEPQTYRRRRIKARRSNPRRRQVISESEEDDDDESVTPKDDVVLTTSRSMDGEATETELVVFKAPTSTSSQEPASAPIHEQAVKCLLSAIEEQSTGMKNLLKHLEFKAFLD
ncbi:hypothetical protein Dimus_001498, partial [Dionaea muscipula]